MIATDNVGTQQSQLIRVIIFLCPQCPCVGERKNQEKSFIAPRQLPLWSLLALVSASAFQAFRGLVLLPWPSGSFGCVTPYVFCDQPCICVVHNNLISGVPCVGSRDTPFLGLPCLCDMGIREAFHWQTQDSHLNLVL
jgi:hypothetical protein